MAIYTIQMFKEHPFKPGRTLSNTYHVSTGDLALAVTAVPAFAEYEIEIHDANFTITYARVSTLAVGDDSFATVVINEPGIRSASGDTMPLFNTLRLDVNTVSGGRPSRWHYRGIHETEVSELLIASGTRLVFTDAWNALVTAIDLLDVTICQPDAQDLSDTATAAPQVKQRSLSRRRRKNTI